MACLTGTVRVVREVTTKECDLKLCIELSQVPARHGCATSCCVGFQKIAKARISSDATHVHVCSGFMLLGVRWTLASDLATVTPARY